MSEEPTKQTEPAEAQPANSADIASPSTTNDKVSESADTMPNDHSNAAEPQRKKYGNLKPFVKGDPRINRKGSMQNTFPKLRSMAQRIADEPALDKDGKPIIIRGHEVTTRELILYRMAGGKEAKERARFLEVADGKVPNPVDITSNGDSIKTYVSWSPEQLRAEAENDSTGDV